MRIVVEDLPEEGRRFEGETTLELGNVDGPDGLGAPEPVRYRLTARRDGDVVHIDGSLKGAVECVCGRCADIFHPTVEREFTVRYRAADGAAAGERGELDEQDLSLDYYEGDAIDGGRLLAEQVLLALPMKLLCAEECRGLCAQCGANLNETECDCPPRVDPRLAPLSALRDRH